MEWKGTWRKEGDGVVEDERDGTEKEDMAKKGRKG